MQRTKMKAACSSDNSEESPGQASSHQMRSVAQPTSRAWQNRLRTKIRNASASPLQLMYLAKVILRPCKNASQTTQVRLSHLYMRQKPKNASIILCCRGRRREDKPAPRTLVGRAAKGEPLRNRLPSRHRINVPDLKIAWHKNRLHS